VENLLLWVFYLFSFYAFLPGLLSRMFGFRVIKRGFSDTEISLTFDDGPDPQYTPQLLDLLHQYQVKATFFIVGKHAEKYPEIIRRMHREGHSIGIHNYSHQSNWIIHPKAVSRHVRETSNIIERITGIKPQFYRPPWGILNVFDLASRENLQIVLWSIMPGDWRKSTGAQKIRDRMLKRLRGGAIILLHDSGNTLGADLDAPQHTIEALKEFIPLVIERGYRFVRVDELVQAIGRMAQQKIGVFRRLIVRIWLLWEQCFHVLFRLKPAIPDQRHSFLHYRITTYTGQPIILADGEQLIKGDRVVELHMDNSLLYEYGKRARSPVQLAIQLIRAMERTMPQLCATLLARDDIRSIKAIIGITMVHRGVEQFGFSVSDLPENGFSAVAKIYLKLLLSVIHPQGKARLAERREMLVPKQIAISVVEVTRRYGTSTHHQDIRTS
jgi:peptidoglycan/xylan/chitin deacetylase (PgdA/CDA1 family)